MKHEMSWDHMTSALWQDSTDKDPVHVDIVTACANCGLGKRLLVQIPCGSLGYDTIDHGFMFLEGLPFFPVGSPSPLQGLGKSKFPSWVEYLLENRSAPHQTKVV